MANKINVKKATEFKKFLQAHDLSPYRVVKNMGTMKAWEEVSWYQKINGQRTMTGKELRLLIETTNSLLTKKTVAKENIPYVIERLKLT